MKKFENKESAVILNSERSELVSKSQVTSVEFVVHNGAKTKQHHVLKRYLHQLAYSSSLKMTFSTLTLAAILSAEIACESWAKVCDCGTEGHESECCWELDSNGVLTITAGINPATGKSYENVVMADYGTCIDNECFDRSNAPWAGSEENSDKIKAVVVGEGIDTIGQYAFFRAANLSSLTAPNVKNIKELAFAETTSLESVDLPSVEKLYDLAFASSGVKYANIPSNAEYCYPDCDGPGSAFYDEDGNPCGSGIAGFDYTPSANGDCRIVNEGGKSYITCGSCGNNYAKSGSGCVSDCGSGFLGKNGKCISATEGCGIGYKQIENWCNRIRYTPAEAAAAAKDDNTNVVTITFKK